MRPPVHPKPEYPSTFDRLDMLWEKHPAYHEMTVFSSMDELLEEHGSWKEDFEEIREEYEANDLDRFLVQLSISDLAYRQATRRLIESSPEFPSNPYVKAFLDQFKHLDTDTDACFIFPESYVSQFFVITEVCKKAKEFHPVRNLFPDEEKVHYLAVFDKENMEDVLLMYHLLYTNTTEDLFGGYSLYDYSFVWYQTHLMEKDTVLRSPYLPDPVALFLGGMPYCCNPMKTVQVRRNIAHILESGYFFSELEFFLCLIREIMPLFQWWYKDLSLYEEKDGYQTDWKLERTKIRTKLTSEGIIRPKWKHELTLFNALKKEYPDTLYQYRPDWLGMQSLDLYIPSLKTAIEYQGVQHYRPVEFFGGEEAFRQRNTLDSRKKQLCYDNDIRLIEWPYALDPTLRNIRKALEKAENDQLAAFLKLKSFEEYMEQLEQFEGLENDPLVFEKEQQLMESDEAYSHREKEQIRERKKKEITETLHQRIEELRKETEEKGIWRLPIKGRGKIEIRYHYPHGKRGDILHYLAGMYEEPHALGNEEYVIKIRRKDYALIELMTLSNRNFFTKRPDIEEPAVAFMIEYNRIAEIESLMARINTYKKEEYRSLRTIEEKELKKLLSAYHKKINEQADAVYEYLIGEGLTNPRWKSEQTAYAIVKAHYEDAKFQYQPDFLFGQKIDIFIPSVNTAIEYQGKQHYSPVEFFGGEEGQKQNAVRDMRKFRRCRDRGITVLYWDYDKPLTDDYFVNEIMPNIKPEQQEET